MDKLVLGICILIVAPTVKYTVTNAILSHFQHRTPAMAENIIDRVLALKELLFIIPKLLS
jgi:ABC-type transport system involved in cytochrome bd biosynthesis fused ATPase/permease subunit